MSGLARLVGIAVKRVGIPQSKKSVNQSPGENHAGKGEQQVNGEMTRYLLFVNTDQKADREERRASRHYAKDENRAAPDILFPRSIAQLVLWGKENRDPNENQHNERENVPGRSDRA